MLTTREWQRRKLKPNLKRDLRWVSVELQYFSKVIAPLVFDAFEIFSSCVDDFTRDLEHIANSS